MSHSDSKPVPKETAEFVNTTVSDALNLQLRVVDVVHNKSNWLAGYNVAILGGILTFQSFDFHVQFLLILPFFLSLVCVMLNFWAFGFSAGPSIEQIYSYRDIEYVNLVPQIDDVRIKHYRENEKKIGQLLFRVKLAIGCFYVGLGLLLITYLIKYLLCLV
jgi:hypothetical protein